MPRMWCKRWSSRCRVMARSMALDGQGVILLDEVVEAAEMGQEVSLLRVELDELP